MSLGTRVKYFCPPPPKTKSKGTAQIYKQTIYNLFSLQDKESYDKLLSVLMEHKAFPDGIPRRAMCDFERSITAVLAKYLPWTEVKTRFISDFYPSIFLFVGE